MKRNLVCLALALSACNDPLLHDLPGQAKLPEPGNLASEPQSLTTPEDTALAVTLTATGSTAALTFAVTQVPAHGTLTGTPPNVSYTPAANYFGDDSFSFS